METSKKIKIGVAVLVAVVLLLFLILEWTGFGKDHRPDLTGEGAVVVTDDNKVVIDEQEATREIEPIQDVEQTEGTNSEVDIPPIQSSEQIETEEVTDPKSVSANSVGGQAATGEVEMSIPSETPSTKQPLVPSKQTYEQHVMELMSRQEVPLLDDSAKYDWKAIIDYIDDRYETGPILQISKMYISYTEGVNAETGNHMVNVYIKRSDRSDDIRYVVKDSVWYEPDLTDKDTKIKTLQVLQAMVMDASNIDLGL